jgi:pilus assembly protein CpaF
MVRFLSRHTKPRAPRVEPYAQALAANDVAMPVKPPTPEPPPQPPRLQRPEFINAKIRIHYRLLDDLNLSQIERMSREELRDEVSALVSSYVGSERLAMNAQEMVDFVEEVIDELTGLGPIEPLLKDPSVTDILINTHRHIYIERGGQLEPVPIRFKDEAHVLRVVNKIVGAVGRRVDESHPMVDARLTDGSRVNVAIRPVAVDGPLVSIRKFSRETFDLGSLVERETLSNPMAVLLREAVRCKLSIVVSGGTGSGKTTLLNALSSAISHRERLITIEDAAELQLQQPHVGRLETRPPTIEGEGEIRQRELVKNALRMRPDRIIVGEVRGQEAFDMLQAMSTGHEGSMTTIHANSPRDAIGRLEQMIGLAGFNMTEATVRAQIASAINIVIQLQRFIDGKRRVTSISEITGMEGTSIQMQELFRFHQTAILETGDIRGEFRATGFRPSFIELLRLHGADFDEHIFQPGVAR